MYPTPKPLRRTAATTAAAADAKASVMSRLGVMPHSPTLAGGDGELRVRTGDFRIIYDIRGDVLIVLVLAVG